MARKLKIDFVSDISCPWCAIGISALDRALERLGDSVRVDMHVQPFELNPGMPSEGEEITAHLAKKYGSTPEQQAEVRETIRQRGAAVGFTFRPQGRDRIYNTFAAHRLLHWAGLPETRPVGRQPALKKALFRAYFSDGENPSEYAVLRRIAAEVGYDEVEADEVLVSGRYVEEVRERERYYTDAGIHAVPAVIIDERYLISGGQPVEVFENALRKIAGEPV